MLQPHFIYPLNEADRKRMFLAWCKSNVEALKYVELKAIELNKRIGRVSSNYLIEWMRYELPIKTHGIAFIDINGKKHIYRINNTDSPQLARYLKAKYPKLNIEMRKPLT